MSTSRRGPARHRAQSPQRRRAALALGGAVLTTTGMAGAFAAPAGAAAVAPTDPATCSATGTQVVEVGDNTVGPLCKAVAGTLVVLPSDTAIPSTGTATSTAAGSGSYAGAATNISGNATSTARDGGYAIASAAEGTATATSTGVVTRNPDSKVVPGASAIADAGGTAKADLTGDGISSAVADGPGATSTTRATDTGSKAGATSTGVGSSTTATAAGGGTAGAIAETGGVAQSYANGAGSTAVAGANNGQGAYAAAGFGGTAVATTDPTATAKTGCSGGFSGAYDTASDTGAVCLGTYTYSFTYVLPAPGVVPAQPTTTKP